MKREEILKLVLDEVEKRNQDKSNDEKLKLIGTFKRINAPALKFLCDEWGLNYEKK